jgi:oligopeptide/dipeptide ABC transporter ATP-binding protein
MSSDPARPLLEVRDLTIRFDRAEVVSGLSFSVAAGEILALVGESGSGKTQTGLAVLGLSPPAASLCGTIVFEGKPLPDDPAERRQLRGSRMALVPQDPMNSLNPYHTVSSQIEEVLAVHARMPVARSRQRSLELLDAVGIKEPKRVAESYPHQLSGGMRQRALIAMALAGEPRLIVADEPTTALDSIVQARILDLLAKSAREFSISILLISHNLAVVSRIADRVGVLYAGALVETAPAAELFAVPRHPYSKALLAAIPRLVGAVELPSTLPGTLPTSRRAADRTGCPFEPRCPSATMQCRSVTPEWRVAGPRGMACHNVADGPMVNAA